MSAPAAAPEGMRGRVAHAVHTLNPAYFAVVMATGIISVGLHLKGVDTASAVLLVLAEIAYGVLVILTIVRLTRHGAAVRDELHNPERAFGFFTFIAGSNVLGTRLALDGHHVVAAVLLVVATALWVVLGYAIPWTAVLGTPDRPVIKRANGTWFVWIVASQSIAILAAILQPTTDTWHDALSTLAVISWAVGIFLYAGAAIFVALRMLMYPFTARDMTPPYWVSMGAAAITVLAGARIVLMEDSPTVNATRELIAGLAVLFWAFATWLYPALIAAGIWRHVVHKVPLRYDASLWALVFPVGMYGVASITLAQADTIPAIGVIGTVELWFAVVVWASVFIAMVIHLWQSLIAAKTPSA